MNSRMALETWTSRGLLALAAATLVAIVTAPGCREGETTPPGAGPIGPAEPAAVVAEDAPTESAAPVDEGAARPRPAHNPEAQPDQPGQPTQPAASAGESGRMQGMTAAHNQVRARLKLPPLVWSDQLARYAEEWAGELQRRGCQLDHRPNRGRFAQKYGENLFMVQGVRARAEDVVGTWVEESQYYNPRTNACSGICGHYTQVVWRTSRQLGCAVASCDRAGEVWVCNYDPPGNFVGQRPF